MDTFPFVTFRILNPIVGIMSSLNCPAWSVHGYRASSTFAVPRELYGGAPAFIKDSPASKISL